MTGVRAQCDVPEYATIARIGDVVGRWHQFEVDSPAAMAEIRGLLSDAPAVDTPAEPTGLGAVVRDGDGTMWVRVGVQWRQPDNGWFGPWQTLHGPVTVLSEGVTV